MATASELPVDTSASAMDMADAMFGTGIKVVSATYTGADTASGIYSNGDAIAPDLTPSDTGVILSTGRASDVTSSEGDPNVTAGQSTSNLTAGDERLSQISGQETMDAAIFEAVFIPEGSTLTMQIVFSSEEYLEYVSSGFNDAVGVWVNGVPATLTVGTGDITINNINNVSNSNLYIDNPDEANVYNTEMDGFTVTLTLKATVIPGEVNTIKIAIADGGDDAYDSNLLIAGNSIQTALIAIDDAIGLTNEARVEYDVLANDVSPAGSTLTITEINGQPVVLGDTIMLSTGEKITLTENGLTILRDGDTVDNADTNSFSYTVKDEDGNTDVAFVTFNRSVPCFVAGTMIDTPDGAQRIEEIEVGDLVTTLDHGPRPVRWIGRLDLSAPDMADTPARWPIRINAGALAEGRPTADLLVSPQHRVLVRSRIARRMFDCDEVLVAAKQLLALSGIAQVTDLGAVTYLHLLFDRHEVVMSNGVASESLLLGPEVVKAVGAAAYVEILALSPPVSDGQAARQLVVGKQARALASRHQKNGVAIQTILQSKSSAPLYEPGSRERHRSSRPAPTASAAPS